MRMRLTGDLRGEPLHDMNWGLDQLQSQLHYHRHAQAAGADACQQQSTPHSPFRKLIDHHNQRLAIPIKKIIHTHKR